MNGNPLRITSVSRALWYMHCAAKTESFDIDSAHSFLSCKNRCVLTPTELLGREVAVLIDGERPAGIYSVVWDASAHTGGVYFYRLQAGTFLGTKKLVFLR